MEEYRVKQIQPNHADHISGYKDKYLNEMFSNEFVIAQPKYDGERMLIHIDGDNIYCTSRRISKQTNRFMENQDKLPILKEKINLDLKYTVLDCECYSKDWSTVVGILHSLPERAIELQKNDEVKFAVFDCLFYDGHDIRDDDYFKRFSCAVSIVAAINYKNIHIVKYLDNDKAGRITCKKDWETLMNQSIENGFEGIVLKSLDRKYYEKGASLKCKKFETIDCVIVGYKDGTGKYENQVGALEIGYYEPSTNKFVRISNVNCGTDEIRKDVTENKEKYLYSVVEVLCQEITDKSLRHPRFIRFREDKSYQMVTRDTIFK